MSAEPSSEPFKASAMEPFPATSAVLLAAAFVIEDACKPVNDLFMICRSKSDDPADCVPAGVDVRACIANVFERIKKSPCQNLSERYWHCLDMNNQDFIYCREEELAFHKCVQTHLGLRKRLWKGVRPEDGFKDEVDLPAWNSWRYRYHVWSHKR